MAMPMSDYEKRRLENIADNKRILAALGLLDPLNDKPSLSLILDLKKKRKDNGDSEDEPARKKIKKSKVVLSDVSNANLGSLDCGAIRRSARNQQKNSEFVSLKTDEDDEVEDAKPRLKVPPNRENFYGAIPNVEIGTLYDTRMESCVAGVHRPTVAGIHGGPDGAYSIALSGGYEDDIDMGEFFTYTGEGGRDLKGTKTNPKNLRTAPQSKDQTLTRGNLALKRNVDTGNPVRVIRGYKLKSPYAPEDGYRYDGLYTVEKAWFTTGLSGYGVWKFAMKRCEDQAPPPWKYVNDTSADSKVNEQNHNTTSVNVNEESVGKDSITQNTEIDNQSAVHIHEKDSTEVISARENPTSDLPVTDAPASDHDVAAVEGTVEQKLDENIDGKDGTTPVNAVNEELVTENNDKDGQDHNVTSATMTDHKTSSVEKLEAVTPPSDRLDTSE